MGTVNRSSLSKKANIAVIRIIIIIYEYMHELIENYAKEAVKIESKASGTNALARHNHTTKHSTHA
jgi:hypothetical protein